MTEYLVTRNFDRKTDAVLCAFIGEALALAESGDIITLDTGVWDEAFVVNKGVTIQGRASRDETVVQGAVRIHADNVTVRRLTIAHPERPLNKDMHDRAPGLTASDVSGVTVSDCTVQYWNPALLFTRCRAGRVEGCLLRHCQDYAAFLNQCEGFTFVGNRSEGCSWFGVRLSWARNNRIEGNVITEAGWIGVLIDRDSRDNVVALNNIEGSNVGIAVSSGGNTFESNVIDRCNHGILVGTTAFDREVLPKHEAPKEWTPVASSNDGNAIRANVFRDSKREDIVVRGGTDTVVEGNTFARAAFNDIVVVTGDDQRIDQQAARLCDLTKGQRHDRKPSRLLWGDTHMHTEMSDGGGTVREGLAYGRDALGLDFVGSADHDWHIVADTERDRWAEIRDACRDFHAPGKFIAIPGIELTYPNTWWSHLNVYYAGFDGEFTCCRARFDDGSIGLAPVAEALAKARDCGTRSLVIRHHFMNSPLYWDRMPDEPDYIVGADICSVHANWEKDGDYNRNAPWASSLGTLRQGLQRGRRFAVMAGSDTHFAFPGDYALTAVLCDDLTLDGLFDAFTARRTYATTGEKIEIAFTVDGHGFGEAYQATAAPEIRAQVRGTAELKTVQIVRDNCVVYSVPCARDEATIEWTDPDWRGHSFYYLRVVQRDWGKAWTTPVWIQG